MGEHKTRHDIKSLNKIEQGCNDYQDVKTLS